LKSDFCERVFHPEDVKRLRDERQQALCEAKPFENEQRARGRTGKVPMVSHSLTKPLLDETGQPLRWYASGTTSMISNARKPSCDTMSAS